MKIVIDISEKEILHTGGVDLDTLMRVSKLFEGTGFTLHEIEEEEDGEQEIQEPETPLQSVPGWWQQPWFGVPQPNTGGYTVPPGIMWTPTLVDGFNKWTPDPGPFDHETKQYS